ncbi:MAG: hypothetical protein KKB62_00815 [Nanoarchaeota archaeon]|nr:hypothetical protein [Nanoarchaeota archaeon]
MVKEDEYLLTNQEILGGIKAAIERGQTLKDAMMSFYQAGYKKEEIEDAAKAYLYLQRGTSEAEVFSKNQGIEKKEEEKQDEKKDVVSQKEKMYSKTETTRAPEMGGGATREMPKKIVQKVSSYSSQDKISKLRGKTVTVVLIIVLAVLMGILAMVFLFRSELINFINSLFG